MRIRRADPDDLAAITLVRTSVDENHLSIAEMAARGITSERIISDLVAGKLAGWVAEEGKHIVAFSMADRSTGQIFALFTMPGYECRGYGAQLLAQAVGWLKGQGHSQAWLSTGRDTAARRFYQHRGWTCAGEDPDDSQDVVLRKAL